MVWPAPGVRLSRPGRGCEAPVRTFPFTIQDVFMWNYVFRWLESTFLPRRAFTLTHTLLPARVRCEGRSLPERLERRRLFAAASAYTVIDLGTLGGRESFAYDINNSNQVVGYAQTGTGA